MKTILITGINGFLGSHLASSLKGEYNVIGLENSISNLFRIKHLDLKVYSSEDSLEDIFSNNQIYAVIHAATIYRRENESINRLLQTNIVLPTLLFELSEKHKVEKFINTDSFFNSNENRQYNYLKDYTLSKQQVIQWLQLQQKTCCLIDMKVFHMYGENDSPSKFVPTIIEKLKKNENIDLTKGEQTRDFIYIDDVTEAYKTILKVEMDKINCEYDLCTGKSISIRKFVESAKEMIGSKSILNWGALTYLENEIMESIGNPLSLFSTGWKPKFMLKEGLAKIS